MSAKAYQAKRPVSVLVPAGGVANQLVATTNGTALAMQTVGAGMLTVGAAARSTTKVVAAVGASADIKAIADYICDGTADDVEINAALVAAAANGGGIVQLSEGTFTLASYITMPSGRQVLRGMGMGATTLLVMAGGATAVPAINDAMIRVLANFGTVMDLTIDGNKTNNSGQTNMRLVSVDTGQNQLIQRVRMINSPVYGLVVRNGAVSAVIRDCMIDACNSTSVTLRAAANNPTVASGLMVKGGASYAIVCDDGPVTLSDCFTWINANVGYLITSGPVALTNCIAQGNGSQGFNTSGSGTQFTNCKTVSGNGGFVTSGASTQFIGCVADAPSLGDGFLISGAATDVVLIGCTATSVGAPYASFKHESTGKATYYGCQAITPVYYGWRVTAGDANIQNCTVVGTGSSFGFQLEGGAHHTVDGCRVTDNGGYGIYANAASVPNLQITNNHVTNTGAAGDNNYDHIYLNAAASYVQGNMMRGPLVVPRPRMGVNAVGLNICLGENDLYIASSYSTAILVETSSPTFRKSSKGMYGYTATTDLMNGLSMTAPSWYPLVSGQQFQVDDIRDVTQIDVSCFMQIGAGSGIGAVASRLIVDGVEYKLGENFGEVATKYQNPFAGGGSVIIPNLAAGLHTFSVEVRPVSYNSFGYLRAATAPFNLYEALNITVQGFMR